MHKLWKFYIIVKTDSIHLKSVAYTFLNHPIILLVSTKCFVYKKDKLFGLNNHTSSMIITKHYVFRFMKGASRKYVCPNSSLLHPDWGTGMDGLPT